VPVSLVICDLDHFKAVNDTWGHAAGDRVIAAFSATLRESAAGHHVVGRIGGEEFAALLPGFNLPAARLFAESVRMAFAGRAIEGFPEGESFTASFGVAEIAPGETAASLLLRADLALYEAKRAGRDCVRLGADADGERRGTTAIDRRGA
jgi:diguanylate cyclase (GGDEF)-like protein